LHGGGDEFEPPFPHDLPHTLLQYAEYLCGVKLD
jgi:hypothetical protein